MPYTFWRVIERYSIFIKQWIFNNLIPKRVRWHRLLINISDDHKWQENSKFSTKKIHWQDVQDCHTLLFRTDHSQSSNIFPKNCSKLVSTAPLRNFKEIISLMKKSKKNLYSGRITRIEEGAWLPRGLNILQHPSQNPKVWEVLCLIPPCFFVHPKPQCILLYLKINSYISKKWNKRNKSEIKIMNQTL